MHATDIAIPKSPLEQLGKIKILIMDSSNDAIDLIKDIFLELGFTNIIIANDGFQGVQIIKDEPVHLIFTDRELKVIWNISNSKSVSDTKIGDILPLTGVQFTQRLRQSTHSPNPYVPVIMMIDDATGRQVLEARDSGVNEVITRPVNAEDFCGRIISIIDHPRIFITADSYKGPCRRRKDQPLPESMKERRMKKIRIKKH